MVTDLGTEFGVEVSRDGTQPRTSSAARSRLALAADDGPDGRSEVVLRENESARVEKLKAPAGRGSFTQGGQGNPSGFVAGWSSRQTLDLLDIVAGGDGMGHRREHGVNLANAVYDYAFLGGPERLAISPIPLRLPGTPSSTAYLCPTAAIGRCR